MMQSIIGGHVLESLLATVSTDGPFSKRVLFDALSASYLPSTEIIDRNFREVRKNKNFPCVQSLSFCYKTILQVINCLKSYDFLQFDALTTTTCCHGVSLSLMKLLKSIQESQLEELEHEGKSRLKFIESREQPLGGGKISCNWVLPAPFVYLCRLFLLSFGKDFCEIRGQKTAVGKLKNISPIGTRLSSRAIEDLQIHVANLVASQYHSFAGELPDHMLISDHPVCSWQKYVAQKFTRIDRRGRKYVACLYSMQVTLASISFECMLLCVVNDIRSEEGYFKEQYCQVLKGDGQGGFVEVEEFRDDDPIIVFGGVVYDDHASVTSIKNAMRPWLPKFSQLVLACDTKYPQFPKVGDDPDFDSSPIIPDEPELQETIKNAELIKGVCANDPSLFCLVHIYVASGKQIKNNELPKSFLSAVARNGKK